MGRAEAQVRRLRQRIFTPSRAGEYCKVRGLHRLMLRYGANALLSTRSVTQINQGRGTAGIDGLSAMHGSDRAELARWVQQGGHKPPALPVRRIYIPKANGKRHPLGIPVIADRASQAMVLDERLSCSSARPVSTHGTRSFGGLRTDRAHADSPVTGLLMGVVSCPPRRST